MSESKMPEKKRIKLFGRYSIPFHGISLKYKLLLFCLVIIFIPIFLIGYLFVENMTSAIIYENTRESTNSVYQIQQNVGSAIKLTEDMSDLIYLNLTLKRALSKHYHNPGESVDVYIDLIHPFITINRELHSGLFKAITIYLDNDSFLQNGDEILTVTEEVKKQEWYKKAIKEGEQGYRVWGEPHKDETEYFDRYYQLSLYRNLNYMGESIGVLEIKIDEKYFYSMLTTDHTEKVLMIVNPEGRVVSSTDRSLIGETTEQIAYLDEMYQSDMGKYEIWEQGRIYTIIYDTAISQRDMGEWKVVSIVPMDVILDKVHATRNMGILFCFICFLLLTIVIIIFSKRLSHRIQQLVDKTNKVVEGEYNELVEVSGYDEIGKLGHSFNRMLKHLNELINEVFEDKIKMQEYRLKQKESELIALQNQINPHFLYNTLDAIRMHAIINGEESIADMLVSLSSLLRYSINAGKEITTVKDEVQHAMNYVKLMKIRYEENLNVETEVDDEIKDCQILKLVLQPLIENAIQHGIRQMHGKGRIKIVISREEEALFIEVSDNGVGMSEQAAACLREELSESRKKETAGKIGLYNVNNRIKLYFGPDYGINLNSSPGRGTRVLVKLPYEKEGA